MNSPTTDISAQVEALRAELAKASLELKRRMEAAVDADHRYRLDTRQEWG